MARQNAITPNAKTSASIAAHAASGSAGSPSYDRTSSALLSSRSPHGWVTIRTASVTEATASAEATRRSRPG